MRRDHGTEREEQDNRLSSLDVNLADNRTGMDRSEATQRSKEDKPSKIDEADSAEAPVYYHESGDLFAEDIEQHLAVLPEMSTATEEVTINDIQIGGSGRSSHRRSTKTWIADLEEPSPSYGEGKCSTTSGTRGDL
uniref:Uncharacterized protein n=1 Tax=Peronospora matthiolae TaxID=2874970 RepID=A0AAV1TU99_9STRA